MKKNKKIQIPKCNITFKKWIENHDLKRKWKFSNPENIEDQLRDTLADSGNLDLRTIFLLFFELNLLGLTNKQKLEFKDYYFKK